MEKENFEKNYSIQTIQRGVKVLRAFSRENTRLTLMEINKLTGITKSSLQRILYTLTMEGLLEKNEKDRTYQLGLDFIFFAELVERNSTLLSVAKNVIQKIHEQTSENISLSVIEKNMRKCIYNTNSKHELTTLSFAGQTSPLFAGASAKVLLAFQRDEYIQKYLDEINLEKITDNTITTKEGLLENLKEIRNQGYAISKSERIKGANSITSPIFDPYSRLLASITITIPSARIDEYNLNEITEIILNAAKEISEIIRRDNY